MKQNKKQQRYRINTRVEATGNAISDILKIPANNRFQFMIISIVLFAISKFCNNLKITRAGELSGYVVDVRLEDGLHNGLQEMCLDVERI